MMVSQDAVNDGPESMNALVGHKLPWKHRAGLLGQLSSVMKFVWLLLCFQAVCSGHPADSSICIGKAHHACCAY